MSRRVIITGVIAAVLALVYTVSARPEFVNFKIGFNVTDARGRPLAGLNDRQPVVTISFANTTIQKDCTSCIFDIKKIELINGTAVLKFNLSVVWIGKPVYYYSETLYIYSTMNNTLIEILNGSIRIQALNLEVTGINDEGERLSGCLVEVRELNVQLKCGQSVTLPFGVYSVTDAFYEIAPNTRVKVPVLTTPLHVSNTTLTTQVALGIAGSHYIDVRRADGSPLSGAEIELVYIDARNLTLFKGVTQGAPLRLRNIPYGHYLVTVAWKGEQLLRTVIQVDRTVRNTTLTTKIIPAVALNVLDSDHQPIANLTLRVSGPARDILASTDALGRILIQDAIEGLYTIRLIWMNQTITRQVYVQAGEASVVLPLRRLTLRFTPSTKCRNRCSLPAGLSIKVLYGNTVLMEASTARPTSAAEFVLPNYVLTNTPLKLEASWNNTLLLSEIFTPEERVISFELGFFELSIRINDARGDPLPRALVIVTDSIGRRFFTSDVHGLIDARYFYGDSVLIEVVWSGTTVAKHLVDASSEQITVNTFVYPVIVEINGVLGPIANARVTAIISGFDYSFNSSAITGSDGRVELKVPYPPGSNSTLIVTKGRFTFQMLLSAIDLASGEPVKVKLDLLIDYGWVQLATGEAITITIAVVVALTAALLVYKYIAFRRTLKGVFTTYGGETVEEEEEEGEGLFGKLRSIFEAEREKEEEEEEESGLFYEEF